MGELLVRVGKFIVSVGDGISTGQWDWIGSLIAFGVIAWISVVGFREWREIRRSTEFAIAQSESLSRELKSANQALDTEREKRIALEKELKRLNEENRKELTRVSIEKQKVETNIGLLRVWVPTLIEWATAAELKLADIGHDLDEPRPDLNERLHKQLLGRHK